MVNDINIIIKALNGVYIGAGREVSEYKKAIQAITNISKKLKNKSYLQQSLFEK